MQNNILGIHHVTAITSDAQRNIDFYTGFLGLRLIKVTVNFDDPSTYHLYYGDSVGHPGTIITFFAWPGAPRGRQGTGQINAIAFAIPRSSLGYWIGRLIEYGIQYKGPTTRFDEQVISLRDPDGLAVELVARPGIQERLGWESQAIPTEHAIRGFAGVTIWEDDYEQTNHVLSDILGFRLIAEKQHVFRYEFGAEENRARLDVRHTAGFWRGAVAAGTVHHVALRAATDEVQQAWHDILVGNDLNVTSIRDRKYFHSIYFPEPGGVLFEIATDLPGFTIDESAERLGTQLQLPPWLEAQRSEIERVLPPLRWPSAQGEAEWSERGRGVGQ